MNNNAYLYTMKICSKCKIEKPYNDFHKHKRYIDGYQYECKKCRLGHEPHDKDLITHKVCTKCNTDKLIEDYPWINYKKIYKQSYCKVCQNRMKQIKRRDGSIEDKKHRQLRAKYKISLSDYNIELEKQGGVCLICKEPESRLNSKGNISMLAVDHCHETHKIRGLLCGNCNIGLGSFKDRSDFLLSAIEYLKNTCTDKS